MEDRLARLETTVDALRSAVESLQQRVVALEATRGAVALPEDSGTAGAWPRWRKAVAAGATSPSRDPYDPVVVLSLIGRLFLVLAGGFFLRAMTEAGLLVPPVGISIAFVYGLTWLYLADRAGGRRQLPNAAFHALAAAMIAFPLLLEAATRFEVLDGTGSALGIAALTGALLFVAWRQRLRVVAWITVVAALPTSLVLLVKTGIVVPCGIYFIALGVATLWLGYALEWTGPRWLAALAANVVVAGVTLRALAPQQPVAPQLALLLQWALVAAYVPVIAYRTLIRGHRITPFEAVQAAAALLIGLGGTVLLGRGLAAVTSTIGVVSAVLGAACYGVAHARLEGLEGRNWNMRFYTTLALVLVLAGLLLALSGPRLGAMYAVLAVVAVRAWSRTGRSYALWHGAAYLVAAGLASGAIGYGARALAATPVGPWPRPGAAALLVLVALAWSARLAAARPTPEAHALASGMRLLLAVLLLVIASGWVIGQVAPVVAGLADRSVDPGALATVRTCVLVAAALAAAWIGRRPGFHEWAWLVYPLLVLVGLKMAIQDFNHSRPATLFIALAMYGTALIVAPRLRLSKARLRKPIRLDGRAMQ